MHAVVVEILQKKVHSIITSIWKFTPKYRWSCDFQTGRELNFLQRHHLFLSPGGRKNTRSLTLQMTRAQTIYLNIPTTELERHGGTKGKVIIQ